METKRVKKSDEKDNPSNKGGLECILGTNTCPAKVGSERQKKIVHLSEIWYIELQSLLPARASMKASINFRLYLSASQQVPGCVRQSHSPSNSRSGSRHLAGSSASWLTVKG